MKLFNLKGMAARLRNRAPRTEVEEQRLHLRDRLDRIASLEQRNRLAQANSYLAHLESQGIPFYTPPPAAPVAKTGFENPARLQPVFVYGKTATGYPFEPKVAFEQDPLYGWNNGMLNEFGLDLSTTVPTNAFPREMWPDRPSSLRTQIAQDAIRFQSRLWFETVPQYAGIVGHLRNYILGAGMTIEVVAKEDQKLAEDVQAWLDAFAKYKHNRLYARLWDSVLNLYRDGEDALQLLPGGEYPEIVPIDASWIRGPSNEVTGPWSFGVLTSWPRRSDDVKAYHLWFPDNSHENVSPQLLKLAKLDTTGSNVKRGVPLAYKIRKQLPQLGKLLDCMAIGEAARQAIPYIQQYAQADKVTVGNAIHSSLAAEYQQQAPRYNPYGSGRDEIQPGEVPHINQGQEYKEPPQGYAKQGTDAYQALCEAVAAACNVPIWFAMGGSDKENYASAFVKESPLVKNIQHAQQIVGEHYEDTLKAAVAIAVAQGTLPSRALDLCDIHCILPTPIARDKQKDIECDLLVVDKGLLSPQSFCTRNELDFDQEQDLIKQAQAAGWLSPAEQYAKLMAENDPAGAGAEAKDVRGDKPATESAA